MYSTCLFCNASLRRNEVLEVFPVGTRLAFDPARGRLWVVCRACERWNLSPLEERWEAVEACEEQYTNTRQRVATPNIGLARLRAGLELVRIGDPLLPELAAWRYGDQFGRRRRATVMKVGAGVGALGLLVGGGIAAGVSVVVFAGGIKSTFQWIVRGSPDKVVARVRTEEGRILPVKRRELDRVRLDDGGSDGWRIVIPDSGEFISLTGPEAYRASGALLPAINRFGGSRSQVARAVSILEEQGSAERLLTAISRPPGVREPTPIKDMDYPLRLALEMAVHDDVERRALQGELAELERAWREAEEIAAIADSLLLPGGLLHTLDRIRGR